MLNMPGGSSTNKERIDQQWCKITFTFCGCEPLLWWWCQSLVACSCSTWNQWDFVWISGNTGVGHWVDLKIVSWRRLRALMWGSGGGYCEALASDAYTTPLLEATTPTTCLVQCPYAQLWQLKNTSEEFNLQCQSTTWDHWDACMCSFLWVL